MEASTNADSAALGMKIHNEQSLGISAQAWAFLPKPGHFCPFLGISAQAWAFLPKPGHFCPSLGISAQAWAFSAHFWAFLPISGQKCLRARAAAQACLPAPACPPLYIAKLPKLPRFQFCPFFPVGVHFHLNDLDLEFFLDFLHAC